MRCVWSVVVCALVLMSGGGWSEEGANASDAGAGVIRLAILQDMTAGPPADWQARATDGVGQVCTYLLSRCGLNIKPGEPTAWERPKGVTPTSHVLNLHLQYAEALKDVDIALVLAGAPPDVQPTEFQVEGFSLVEEPAGTSVLPYSRVAVVYDFWNRSDIRQPQRLCAATAVLLGGVMVDAEGSVMSLSQAALPSLALDTVNRRLLGMLSDLPKYEDLSSLGLHREMQSVALARRARRGARAALPPVLAAHVRHGITKGDVQSLRAANRLAPDHFLARVALACIGSLSSGERLAVLDALAPQVPAAPRNWQVLYYWVRALVERERAEYASAVADAERLLELAPGRAIGYQTLIEIHKDFAADEEVTSLLAHVDTEAGSYPPGVIHTYLGILNGRREFERMFTIADAGANAYPDDPWLALIKSSSLWPQGKWAEALTEVRRAIELDPFLPFARASAIAYYSHTGMSVAEAKEHGEAYMRMDPTGSEAMQVQMTLAMIQQGVPKPQFRGLPKTEAL